jgi:hypothetical protein
VAAGYRPLGQRRQFLRAFRDLDCNVIAMCADVIADEAESLSKGAACINKDINGTAQCLA